jgi:hypothetical protein
MALGMEGLVMRIGTVSTLMLLTLTGCTSTAVNREAVTQTMTIADMRYREVLDNLATLAHNNGTLPSIAITSGGAANVTQTISADPVTVVDESVNGFSKQILSVVGTHSPELNWTIAPVVAEPNLEALKYACLWVLRGRPPEGSREMELLREPRPDDVYGCHAGTRSPGFHFDVARQLDELPPGWLGIGCRRDVPSNACYKAHCCDTYVWVTPDGLAGLSQFTLVVLDIATVYPQSLVLPQPKAKVDLTIPNAPDNSNKITEQWQVCQEPNASGTIKISRPSYIRQSTTQFPDILPDQFIVLPPVPTPKLESASAASPGTRSTAAETNSAIRFIPAVPGARLSPTSDASVHASFAPANPGTPMPMPGTPMTPTPGTPAMLR